MKSKNSISTLLILSVSCFLANAAPSPSPTISPAASRAMRAASRRTQPSGLEHIDSMEASSMIKSLCASTDHPVECVRTLIPAVRNDESFSLLFALETAVKSTNEHIKSGLALARMLLHDKSKPSEFKTSIETCMGSYNAILESNQKVLDAIIALDFYTLNSELGGCRENLESCQKAFDEADTDSSLVHIDEMLEKMVSNNVAFGVDVNRIK